MSGKIPEDQAAKLATALKEREERLEKAKTLANAMPINRSAVERETVVLADDLVLEAGENAGDAARAAADRFRQTRAADPRPEGSSRNADSRPMTWAPAAILPNIPHVAGWRFRWVRLTVRGEVDDLNINQSLREGYVPATLEDIGNIHLICDKSVRFPGGIEIGGLLLCKIPEEVALGRERYYEEHTLAQLNGVNNDMLRENDPRMPMIRPSVSSRTSFGSGLKRA